MITKWRLAAFAGLPFVGILAFLGVERGYGFWGFPLDDAWIHQTYARALAAGTRWSYAGGTPSAGSTSPAWTLLQVPAYWLGVPPVIWSYGCGIILYAMVLTLTFLIVRRLEPAAVWVATLAVAWEWHLVWASLSGMETIFFTAWVLFVLWICIAGYERTFRFCEVFWGVLLGVGIWIRPEALLVIGLGGVCFLGRYVATRDWRKSVVLVLAATLLIILYFWHNFSLGGRVWPNTWYAKPLEYAGIQGAHIFGRIWDSLRAMNAGPLAVVSWIAWLPCWLAFVKRRWIVLAPPLWAVGHVGLYILQLPVVYQHARYDMPAIPILLVYGVVGVFQVKAAFQHTRVGHIVHRAWVASVIVISVGFMIIGARQYALDVAVIETEMVKASQWIQVNTPVGARIAAHDVGALGYWGNRSLIDLGGLTEDDAWPLLAGEVSVTQYLDSSRANYWMTFPQVYAPFTSACQPLYRTNSNYAVLFGEGNMVVYKWPEGCAR
jgi:hypothetical protein